MSNITNPNDILIALAHLQDELPVLVGKEKWNAMKSTFEARVAQLQQTSDAAVSQELLEMLAVSEAASERLKQKVWSVSVLRQMMQEIDPLVSAMGFDPDEIGHSVDLALLANKKIKKAFTRSLPIPISVEEHRIQKRR